MSKKRAVNSIHPKTGKPSLGLVIQEINEDLVIKFFDGTIVRVNKSKTTAL